MDSTLLHITCKLGWKRSKFSNANQKIDLSRKIILWAGLMICVALSFTNAANSSARTPVGFHNLFERLVSINRTKKFAAVDESGGTVLHKAVKFFPVLNETLDIFKAHRVDFNTLDKAGNSAFFNAVQYGRNASFLATLINHGMNWKTRNKNNDTALHVAALHGNTPAINLLISLGSDVNTQNANGRTPLHLALLATNVSQNTVDIVRKLLSSGAKTNILDENGESALQLSNRMANSDEQIKKRFVELLHILNPKWIRVLDELEQLKLNRSRIDKIFQIVQKEDLDTIKNVLSRVGNSTEITELWDKKLLSLLHVAIKFRDNSVVEYLINNQGFAKKLNDTGFNYNLVELCLENISTVFSATFEKKLKVLQLLFNVQPGLIETKVGIVDNLGITKKVTPLLHSLRHEFSNGKQLELIQMFIDNHANVNAIIPEHNITALMLAAFRPSEHTRMRIIRILIENNADTNAVDERGDTFLHYVPEHGVHPNVFHDTVEYLDSKNHTKTFVMKGENELTVLHRAVYYMEVLNKTLEIFKRRRVDFNAVDDVHDSVLVKAIVGGRSTLFLQTLIAFGADWQLKENNRTTVLHVAISWGHLDALKLFIQLGADVNALDAAGNPPLYNVFRGRDVFAGLDLVSELLRHGANPNIQTESVHQVQTFLDVTYILNKKGQSLLHVAIERDDYSLVEYLVNNQGFSRKLNTAKFSDDLIKLCMTNIARVSLAFEQKFKILQFLFWTNPDLIEARFKLYPWREVATPLLHSAAVKFSNGKQSELIQMLIGNRANVYAITSDGDTFLHILATHSTPVVFHETVAYLDSAKNTDFFTIKNNAGETVLYCAVNNMKVKNETLDIFQKRGADFNELDLSGRSILFGAIAGRSDDLFLKTLIAFGADWRYRDEDQNTVLHIAAAWANLDAIKLFIQLGADVNALNIYGNTPFHDVFTYGYRFVYLDFVSQLIYLGAHVNISNNEGKLALDYARDLVRFSTDAVEDGIIQLLERAQSEVHQVSK